MKKARITLIGITVLFIPGVVSAYNTYLKMGIFVALQFKAITVTIQGIDRMMSTETLCTALLKKRNV